MTNIKNTAYIIDGYRMDNNKINTEYMIDQVICICTNTEALYKLLKGVKPTDKKALSIAKNFIRSWCDLELKWHGFNTVCTYNQIRSICKDQFDEIENGVKNAVLDEIIEANR